MRRTAAEIAALVGVLVLVALCAAPRARAAEEGGETGDDAEAWGFYWVPPSAHLDRWLVLFQGYYSGLDGIGAGIEASRLITVPVLSDLTHSQVEFLAQGRLYEQGHGEIRLGAETFFAGGRYAAVVRFDHSTRLREFWGVGPDLADSDREEFRPRELRAYFELLRRFWGLRIGPRVEFHDYQYLRVADGGLLDSGDYPGVSSSGENVRGIGLTADYDSRDDRYHPTRGWWLESAWVRFVQSGEDEPAFWSSYLDIRNYRAITRQDVIALQFFAYGVERGAPVWRYAALGTGEHSRGYSRNRYLDHRMGAIQAEWRRPLVWRLGMQLFGGVALVTPRWRLARIDTLQPTLGAGLSVRVSSASDVPIRGDLAIGDESVHARLSIGFAF